ncbi:hypothetical protein RFI_28473 [Reticulomyxa filosa]|uniref:Uncharacterized protein n=1 Tax=Reticulomyxa filosa TaxID=46433 RepID=X6M4L6_RETFI|nr:hypothetical protein RFI_28473 [Reticulomyxa filosa]|eukprot:ETO08913.1 hypothetical protein RFI_28473 [Reticulomyxa filosa]
MNVKFCLQDDEKTHKEEYAWNAKVENEDEYTQMILLTWVKYDQYIQQTMQISAMWNHQIDLNLIYGALNYYCKKDVNQTSELLSKFEQWKCQNNEQKYKEIMDEFVKGRCCNNQINLFCIFLAKKKRLRYNTIEIAKVVTIQNGLPFVEKDKKNYK